jgi:hypothetical protein
MQEFLPDPAIETNAARDVADIAADLLAEIGHLVDEGDLGREKGVGRVFDDLGRLAAGEDDGRLVQVKRPVERARSVSAPTTTRSGRLKSSIAEPSRRNSGFEAISNSASGRVLRIISSTLRLVPTGTVDFVTITV